jgi:hypothetical protein
MDNIFWIIPPALRHPNLPSLRRSRYPLSLTRAAAATINPFPHAVIDPLFVGS